MRLTSVLCSLVRMKKEAWYRKARIKIIPTRTEDVLKSHGLEVEDVNEVLFPKKKLKKEIVDPLYKEEPCYMYEDNNVLLEGLEQAKVLTNTVEISNSLPEKITDLENKINVSDEVHSEIRKRLLTCCVYDATQDALPRRYFPDKPMRKYPAEYGITNQKKNETVCQNLLIMCEQLSDKSSVKSSVSDAWFLVSLEAHDKKIQFRLTSELVATTNSELSFLADPKSTTSIDLPNLYPVHCTVSLKKTNIYETEDFYPFKTSSKWPYIQTAFVHYDKTKVKNLFEEEVYETQIDGRSLLKGFSIAAAQARSIFGKNVVELPKPIVVPVVQTDAKMFHFTVFQLNTLALSENSEIKNIFWNSPRVPLYEFCEYQKGLPVLEGYNPDIIKKLLAFYLLE